MARQDTIKWKKRMGLQQAYIDITPLTVQITIIIFGLTNAPNGLQPEMHVALWSIKFQFILVFCEDRLTLLESPIDHLIHACLL